MSALSAKLKEEVHALLPPAIFFLITLHIVSLVRVLMLKGTGIAVGTSVTATIAALILAKAVLIADMLPFINLYPHKPLAFNVVWKTTVYVLIAMVVHYLERLIDSWRMTGGLIAANETLLAEMVWPHFWAIQIFLATLILMYCTMRELVRVIGGDKGRRLFFGPLQNGPVL